MTATGSWMAKLRAIAAEHSMEISTNKRFRWIAATRVGPGFPRRLTATAARDTPGCWDAAAHRLHDAIRDSATPNRL